MINSRSLSSLGFQPEVFDDPSEYEEQALRDRKEQLPDLAKEGDKARFVERVIALANTARRYGRAGYYLFGLTDKSQLVGLDRSIGCCYGPPDELETWERVRQVIREALLAYITPEVDWSFEHGMVKGCSCAHFTVSPVAEGPFQTSRAIGKLSAGMRFIRIGDSKQPVSPHSRDECWYAAAEVPYVLPSVLGAYLRGAWSDRQANLSGAEGIAGYQELRTTKGQPLNEVVQGFLDSKDRHLLILAGMAGCGKSAFVQRLVAHWLAVAGYEVEAVRQRHGFETPPSWIPVYVSLRGRPMPSRRCLAEAVVDKVNSLSLSAFWQRRPVHPERVLDYRDLHWLVCLDGLDEIWQDAGRRGTLTSIEVFCQKTPRVKAILTTRPDVSLDALGAYGEVVEIAPFPPELVQQYIASFPGAEDPVRLSEVQRFLASQPELYELFQAPACLEAAVGVLLDAAPRPLEATGARLASGQDLLGAAYQPGGSGARRADTGELTLDEPIEEISREARERHDGEESTDSQEAVVPIRLGVLLERIYDRLLIREEGRYLSDRNHWANWRQRTQQLAIAMDGHQQTAPFADVHAQIGSGEAVCRLLSLGILRQERASGWLRFATPLTKLYFAAAWLKPYLANHSVPRQRTYIDSLTDEFRGQLQVLLSQISDVKPDSILYGGDE